MTQAKNLAKGSANFDSSGVLTAAGGGTGGTTFPAPGTSGNALISDGTVWTSTPISTKPFVTGTSMLFRQTSAPTGWTKVTTLNDYALRVVSGSASTGGSVAFTTAFASQTPTITTSGLSAGATTLATTQIPGHTHSFTATNNNNITYIYTPGYPEGPANSGTFGGTTGSAGGGGSHTHSISGSATSSAINLAVQYVDVIIANID